VARVTKPISPRYEITALLTQLEKQKRFPLLFCENVEGSDAPVVINAQASRKLMAMALECKPEELAINSAAPGNRLRLSKSATPPVRSR
jgi:UbiD family decarboxylase